MYREVTYKKNSMSTLFDLNNCILCPRECHAHRTKGGLGFCQAPATLRAARAALLFYEEPCISGKGTRFDGKEVHGSGAVFFTGCNLGCVFCQNYDISRGMNGNAGLQVTPESLADAFLRLQDLEHAANINLVTGSHYLPVIIPALEIAKTKGLRVPVVYNTASYEKKEAIERLDGLVDIYLPDCKYYSSTLSRALSKAPDYFERAIDAISEMVRQQPTPVFSDGSNELNEEDDANDPLMSRGVIIRHMVMPGHTEDSKEVLRRLYETFGDQVFLSIMNQYTPMPQIDTLLIDTSLQRDLKRTVTQKEYDEVVDFAISLGVENGFLQEGGTVSKSFIPNFDGTGLR